jgi:hypothetical protein
MKTTFDLPENLVQALKLRAVREGRKLKDLAADFLQEGLKQPRRNAASPTGHRIVRDELTGLPVIHPRGKPKRDFSPEELSEILLEQEVDRSLGRGE